jgi:Excalibur calcium-binding domain
MMKRTLIGALIAAVFLAYGPAVFTAAAVVPRKYPNCKTLNKRYAHGVGRFGARDKTSGDPVRNFYRNNRVYELNKGLDRDKDRIACEKA